MSGLLTKLAQGLGAGMTSYGAGMVDQQREARLAKMKTDATSSQHEFTAKESQLDRESRERIAMQNKRSSSKTPRTDYKNVKYDTDPMTGEDTGSFKGQDAEGNWIRYDADSDTFSPMGTGEVEEPEVIKPKAKSSESMSNDLASMLSLDASDYAGMDNEDDRTEERVSSIIENIRAAARKGGHEDAFLAKYNALTTSTEKVAFINRWNNMINPKKSDDQRTWKGTITK